MRILAPISQYAPGTAHAESLLSVYHRIAFTHNVSFERLRKFLGAAAGFNAAGRVHGDDIVSGVMGVRGRARGMAAWAERLSAVPDLSGHTLQCLHGVLSPRSAGALVTRLRWCNECIDEHSGVGYGMFAHLLAGIDVCPSHGCLLESWCPHCQRAQRPTFPIWLTRSCGYCAQNLSRPSTRFVRLGSGNPWVREQLLNLVTYLSDSSSLKPKIDWFIRYKPFLIGLGHSAIGRLNRVDSLEARALARPPLHGLSLPTILWLAVRHSTSITEVLLRPTEVLSELIPGLARIPRVKSYANRYSEEAWIRFKYLMKRLLSNQEVAYLPPLDLLAELMGFETFVHRDPPLFRKYNGVRASLSATPRAIDFACIQFFLLQLGDIAPRTVMNARYLARRVIPLSVDDRVRVSRTVSIFALIRGREVTLNGASFSARVIH